MRVIIKVLVYCDYSDKISEHSDHISSDLSQSVSSSISLAYASLEVHILYLYIIVYSVLDSTLNYFFA